MIIKFYKKSIQCREVDPLKCPTPTPHTSHTSSWPPRKKIVKKFDPNIFNRIFLRGRKGLKKTVVNICFSSDDAFVHAVVFSYEWSESAVDDLALIMTMLPSSDTSMVQYSAIFVDIITPESMGHA